MGFWQRARVLCAMSFSIISTFGCGADFLYSIMRRAKNSPQDCFLNALSNPLLYKSKEAPPFGDASFSWRRARDSNPRNRYSSLHDFQNFSDFAKAVVIHQGFMFYILCLKRSFCIFVLLKLCILQFCVVVFWSARLGI